jgi:glycosyltransferase involved in cell wall biosynthesis
MLKLGIECENLEDPKSRWGVGNIVLNLLQEYAKNPEWQKQFKLYLYFKKRIPDDEVLKNPIFIKRVLNVPSFNIFYHIAMPLRAMADRLDYMFFPAYMLPPLYFRKSIVMLTGDVYHEYKHGNLPFRYKLAYRLFTNWAAIEATKILAISETSKKEVAKLYNINPDKIFVSQLGVSINPKFKIPNPNQIQNSKLESDSNIGNWELEIGNSPYILYVGQMFPRRHAKESIEAFEKIAPDFPGLKFILVGKDKYPGEIIDGMIKEANDRLGEERIIHYTYLERREDIEKLYSGAKLFIYVSDNEAFGLPPVEAASYDVPVIIKDSELNHELFGDAAFFVKDDIAGTMRRGLADESKREYCKNKYKEIIPKYTWKNFAERFFNAIQK